MILQIERAVSQQLLEAVLVEARERQLGAVHKQVPSHRQRR